MNPALLSHGDVARELGLKRSSLYRVRHSDPEFPRPLALPGLSAPKWTRPMIEDYVRRKEAQATKGRS